MLSAFGATTSRVDVTSIMNAVSATNTHQVTWIFHEEQGRDTRCQTTQGTQAAEYLAVHLPFHHTFLQLQGCP